MRDVLQRRVMRPLVELLKQGVAPPKLALTCQRARLADGECILEPGCG